MLEGNAPNNGPWVKIYVDSEYLVFEEHQCTSFIPNDPNTNRRINMRIQPDHENKELIMWTCDNRWWVFPKGTFQTIIKHLHGVEYKTERIDAPAPFLESTKKTLLEMKAEIENLRKQMNSSAQKSRKTKETHQQVDLLSV